MRTFARLSVPIAAAALLLCGAAARAGQLTPTDAPHALGARVAESMRVHTSSGVTRFDVANPDAPSSRASRDNADCAGKNGRAAEATGGYELKNRVIVRTRDVAALRARIGGGLALRPLIPERGYWVIQTETVRDAIALTDTLQSEGGFDEVSVDVLRPWVLRTLPNDPFIGTQWHLINNVTTLNDINIEPAWNLGYTGAGVVVGIVENAWQHAHPDLASNFHADASQTGGTVTAHATSVAGLVAEAGNNSLMGVGVAYGAWISDQIYGTDQETADALLFRNDLNDIKTNSWGPPDTARVFVMPQVIRTAIEEGIDSGRGGLGEIYVWAAGNGGANNDRTDYDPFVSSRYTIAVGAIGDLDTSPFYNERGSSMMVVAPSSGNIRSIYTTTSGSGWTSSFGGTSAASPIAAGVVALMLEARPDLTWRDVQHVLIETTRINDPNNADWTLNGAGYLVNQHYGFGAVDAGAALTLTETWQNLPHEVLEDSGVVAVDSAIPDEDPNGVVATAVLDQNIRVETVELTLNVQTPFIGDLKISITAPSGVESLFTEQRTSDSQDNYVDYTFTSFRHWGENSAGQWSVKIADLSAGDIAQWDDFRLTVHGTPLCPGDLTGEGDINLDDLATLLAAYGACEGDAGFEPAADFDNNGCITLSDLAVFLSRYGQSCN